MVNTHILSALRTSLVVAILTCSAASGIAIGYSVLRPTVAVMQQSEKIIGLVRTDPGSYVRLKATVIALSPDTSSMLVEVQDVRDRAKTNMMRVHLDTASDATQLTPGLPISIQMSRSIGALHAHKIFIRELI